MKRERKMHNVRLWTTFVLMWAVYIVSAWNLVQSPSWMEVVFCCVSAGWCALFGWANYERCEGE